MSVQNAELVVPCMLLKQARERMVQLGWARPKSSQFQPVPLQGKFTEPHQDLRITLIW